MNNTVEPFNLAALKFDDFTCKIILAPFILATSNLTKNVLNCSKQQLQYSLLKYQSSWRKTIC